MYHIKQNYTQNKYIEDDFLRYFNSLTSEYSEKNDHSIEGLDLFNKIIKNIIDNPNEEKYQRLTTNHIINGKPSRLYQYITSDETATNMLIMLGFRQQVYQFEMKWILSFKDRIEFYPGALNVIEKNKQIAVKNKLKPVEEAKQKIEKQKQQVDDIKNKLAGDRAERREINWVKRGTNSKPIYPNSSNSSNSPNSPNSPNSRGSSGSGRGNRNSHGNGPTIVHSSGTGRGYRGRRNNQDLKFSGNGQQLLQQTNLLEAPPEDAISQLRRPKPKFRNVNNLNIQDNKDIFYNPSDDDMNDMNNID